MRYFTIISMMLVTLLASAQENLQRGAIASSEKKTFNTLKVNPITSVKNQYRSGTCWDFATLGYLESEILRKTGKTYDLCEMFVVNKDYLDCATHYVRMHGYSQISEGGSCDDVIEVIRRYGICPEDAMPAPGSLTGDSLANFKIFFPELEKVVSGIVWSEGKPELNLKDGTNYVDLAALPEGQYLRIVTGLSIGVFVEIAFNRLLAATSRTRLSMVTTAKSNPLFGLTAESVELVTGVFLKAKFFHGFFKYWIFL